MEAKDKVFNDQYKRLNKAQKRAVDTIEGPVMVIAGPGTGKTSILTLRIANILKQTDTPANGILALTFTEAGQKAMRLKLRKLMGSRADEVGIFTYHGFASFVINEYQDHFPHLFRSKQITDIETEELVRNILREKKFSKLRPFGDPEYYVGKIISGIGNCKKEAWTPEIVKEFAKTRIETIKNDESSISTRGASKGQLKADALKEIEKCEKTILFSEVYAIYEDKKKEDKKIDFDDLIFELINALKEDELLLRLIQEKYLYILVDEHQDTNDAQNLLIKSIADFFESPNLFIVGDEKQAIYRFQGASVENFLKFQNTWKNMEVISLTDNYRSHQNILDAGFSMIENNYEEGEYKNLRIKLKSAGEEKTKPIEIINAGNTSAGDKYLVDEIKGIREKDNKGSVAIIVRKNVDVERILSLLEANNIRASAERGADIFSHPIGVYYFNLLEYLSDPSKTESLALAISSGIFNLNLSKSANLIKQIRSGDLSSIEKEIPEIAKLRKEILNAGPIEFLINVGNISGITEISSRSPLSIEVWRTIISLSGDIAKRKSIRNPIELIKELLAYKKTAESKSIKIFAGSDDSSVRIMTAHGSKGLEFDYVFLPDATEESWMSKNRGTNFIFPKDREDGDEIKDSRRLFYVALTRARKNVSIISPLEDSLGKALTSIRFISELDKKSISEIALPANYELNAVQKSDNSSKKRDEEFTEYAKSVILEKGLSVTALNHFCECPIKFFYKSILKIPEAPSANSEKGNAMHEAFSKVWHLENKTEKTIENEIIDSIKLYFTESLLPTFEKEVVIEELIKNAPIVAKALVSHFNTAGAIYTEKWYENNFEAKYDKKEIDIRIHGKMDAVIDMNNTVLVYDYKTTKGKSLNHIKGETADSDGSYFRQLIYYRFLLSRQTNYKGKLIEPALVFISPDEKGRCPIVSIPITDEDIKRVEGEINELIESVWSGKFLQSGCGEKDCEFCKLILK